MKIETRSVVALICLFTLAGFGLTAFTKANAQQRHRLMKPLRFIQSNGYQQTNLVSDIAGLAPNVDPKLVNPWGFAESSGGTFRVAANGSGRAILLDSQGVRDGGDIIIPTPAGISRNTSSTPNGVVSNDTSGFVISDNGRRLPAYFALFDRGRDDRRLESTGKQGACCDRG